MLALVIALAIFWKPLLAQAGFQFDSLGNLLIKLNAGGSSAVTDAGTQAYGHSPVAETETYLFGNDGTQYRRVGVDTNGNVKVILNAAGTATPVTESGTWNVGLSAGTNYVGKVAIWADGSLKSGAVTSAMTGTTSTSVIAGTASNNLYITNCVVSNASTTVSTDILLQDGSGGTTLYVLPDPAAAVATTGGGGGSFAFPAPLKVPTQGNGLFAANVTTGSSTKISCSGYISTTSF